MRRHLAIWIIVPLLIGVAAYLLRASVVSQAWRLIASSYPRIDFPRTLELGEREGGRVAVAHFKIGNRGRGELVIDQIRTNCSCSGLEREEGGRFVRVQELRIAPGEDAELSMRWSVSGTPNESARTVILFHTNDPSSPEAHIEAVVSRITGGIRATPAQLVFSTVPLGAESRQVLELRDWATPARTMKRVSCNSPQVETHLLSADDKTTEPKGADVSSGILLGRVEVVLKGTTIGSIADQLRIDLAEEGSPTVVIPLVGRVAPPVEVLPSSLFLPRKSEEGWAYSGSCLCQSSEGKPLSMTLASSAPGIGVRILPVEGSVDKKMVHIDLDPALKFESGKLTDQSLRFQARVGDHETTFTIVVHCGHGGAP
jgi:hypothetical protein